MQPDDKDFVLEVNDLSTHFYSREGTVKAVDGVSFSIERRRTLGIVGESGCGKSVTSQSILRLIPKNGKIVAGQILFRSRSGTVDLSQLDPDGEQMRSIQGREIAMIFQEPMTSFCPVYSIGNQIAEVIALHQGVKKDEARRLTLETLRLVGMPNPDEIIDAYPFNLSGGMRQRAMIAMALSCRPSLLIADEPTTAVDVTIQALVLELMKKMQEELNMAVILITHDLGVVGDMADDVLVMYLGKNVEYGSVRDLFRNPLHPYTRGLIDSIPKLGQASGSTIEPIAGSVPSVYEMPTGCRFHTRCPRFMAGICDKEEPPNVEVTPGHSTACWLYADRGTS
ncbi:MAG: ABC transporter ATP-binding protein [Spirochaetaceae bacterium]|nr:MAG: ABC transporter ATP-binding protein [Spirochaetaceae bacterium]